ncbi:MAG: helix-turn-helix domain-containing protein [Ruminococcaceae bacterium]|nr:helix-turn-helix domain-containing protein [Oscillospiraceae bacterium]
MNSTILSENLKKFRIAKNMTQEQTADFLHVNTQTVSRWECGTTLPDVLTLPELAKLYGVTVDDFYRKHSVAYDNYAQRLSAVYEKTHDPEDFFRCALEYQKLIKNGELSPADQWNYATIHHFMMRHCLHTALEWYEKAAEAPNSDPHTRKRARSLRGKLLFEIGKGSEVIREQQEHTTQNPENTLEWELLIEAFIWAEEYQEAYSCFRTASAKFPTVWELFIYGGEICAALERYEEAFTLWDKAGELGTFFCDDLYCKAACLDDLGEYEKAAGLYMTIAEKLRERSFDVEADMAEEEAEKIRQKIN